MKKIASYLLCFLLCTALSSHKQNEKVDPPSNEQLTSVRNWVERVISVTEKNASSIMGMNLQERRLMWDQYITYELENSTVYQIPVKQKAARYYSIRNLGAQRKAPDITPENLSYNYLVVNKYRDGRMDLAVMTVQAEEGALLKKVDLAGVNYRKVKKDFSGFILFHTWTGLFLNGWKYENGQVAKRISTLSKNANGRILECTTVTLDWYCQTCNDWYTNGTYSHTQCTEWTYCGPAAEMFFCVDYAEPEDPPSGGGSAGGYLSPWNAAAGGSYLCSGNFITMTKIGNGYTGQLNGVGVKFVYNSTDVTQWRYYLYMYPEVCITIPEYGINAAQASEVFRLLWNNAITSTVEILNGLGPSVTAGDTEKTFKSEVESWARAYNPKTTITYGPCSGPGIKPSNAVYGSGCN